MKLVKEKERTSHHLLEAEKHGLNLFFSFQNHKLSNSFGDSFGRDSFTANSFCEFFGESSLGDSIGVSGFEDLGGGDGDGDGEGDGNDSESILKCGHVKTCTNM